MFIGICEGCCKILEDDRPAPKYKSLEEAVDAGVFDPSPHYLCKVCVRKVLEKEKKKDDNYAIT